MTYEKIELESYSAEELLSLLMDSHVLLEVDIDTFDFTCSVTSYAYTHGCIHVYEPDHRLYCCGVKKGNITSTKEVGAKSGSEWTEKFLNGEAWISIYNDSFNPSPYASEIKQIQALLSDLESWPSQTELYLSNDFANFYGPLECDFITWWIKNHPGYHTDTISKQMGNFVITENGRLLRYEGKDDTIVTVPPGVIRVGAWSFPLYCKAEEIILPEGVKTIGDHAFSWCEKLKRISLPESLEVIGQKAFSGCLNLRDVSIPKRTRVGFAAFEGCPPETERLSDNFLIVNRKLVAASRYLKGDVIVPNGVCTLKTDQYRDPILGAKTLYDNTKIRTLMLPKGIMKAEYNTLPRELEYLIVQPGKRTFSCKDSIVCNTNAKIVFHFGRNIKMDSYYRYNDKPLIFVSFSTDNIVFSDYVNLQAYNEYCSRVVVNNKDDVIKIIEDYNLYENSMIMEYLRKVFDYSFQ